MTPSPWAPRLQIPLVLLLGLAIAACGGRKVRTPPDSFLPDAPVDTGDVQLDSRAARARQVATLDSGDVQALRKSLSVRGAPETVDTLALYHLGNGQIDEALQLLEKWVEATSYSEAAMASYLDLTLGADRVEECITAVDQYLVRYEAHPYLLLLRGLCLERYDRPQTALEMYISGLGGIDSLGGLTGVLERELGLNPPVNAPSEATVLQDRLALIDKMSEFNVLGHVLVRHVGGLTVEEAPADPRLVALGGITTEEVDRIFASRREAFRHCQLLSKHRRKIPGGRLVVHLTIRRDGSPGAVERVRDTFEVQEIPACIEEQISHLWFPAPRYGKAVKTEQEFRMLGD